MSESLSTLSAGSRWFENESSKWARHVPVPPNAGRGLGASQVSHMSVGTSTTVQMMTKPESEEMRAMHVLIVADDERGILQKLEGPKRFPSVTDARSVPAGLSRDLINQFDMFVMTSAVSPFSAFNRHSLGERSCQDEEEATEVDAILSLSQALPRTESSLGGPQSLPTERLLHRLSPDRLIAQKRHNLPCYSSHRCVRRCHLEDPRSALYAFDAEDPDFLARRMIAFLADMDAPVVLESD
ncbi:hypothetical protein Emag_005144 [Eimeria magna]